MFRRIVVPLSSWQGTTTRHEVGNSSRQDLTSQKARLSISIAVRKLVSIFPDSYDINFSLCWKVCLALYKTLPSKVITPRFLKSENTTIFVSAQTTDYQQQHIQQGGKWTSSSKLTKHGLPSSVQKILHNKESKPHPPPFGRTTSPFKQYKFP
jgi:hypothetical protein